MKPAAQYANLLWQLLASRDKSEHAEVISFFVKYLQERQALHLAREIVERFSKIYDKNNNLVTVEVVTSRELSEKIRQQVRELLTQELSEQIVLEEKIDKNLIGGLVLRWQDNSIDLSVRTALAKIKDNIN